MKFPALLLVIILIVISSPAEAQNRVVTPLVKCLAQEELDYFNNKKQGPDYHLNQYFIIALSSANNAILKSQYLEAICNNPDFSPSVSLLKHIAIYGLSIFEIRLNDLKQHESNVTSLWTIEEELPNTFMNYLSNLQGETQDPKCLQREIPELPYFFDRLKHLESDLLTKELLMPKEKVMAVFDRIKNFDKIKKKCMSKSTTNK